MLIGIVVGVVIVGALVHVTGLTKQLLSPFRSSSSVYKSSEAATAPDVAIGEWINSEPLKLKDLRGRVVVVEFWTFGCYNCRNTLSSVKGWDARYRENGLTIIGVHTPELDRERDIENVRREVASLGIKYPVLTDND